MTTEEDGNAKPWDDSTTADPFADLDSLKLTQDFGAALGVRKILNTVPVRKPTRHEFIQVHQDPSYRLETAVFELKEEREVYLVSPTLWPELAEEISPRVLFTCINTQAVLFLWPLKRSDQNGRLNQWNESALRAAEQGHRWIRVSSNMGLGGYDTHVALGELAEPVWPDASFQDILRIAFRDRFIDRWEHPVLRRLRGEV